ncbi:olfactory receptor 6B1-like [Pelodytes ibericus]
MSYDRYLAICKPLHYTSIMSLKLPYYLSVWSWLAGFGISMAAHVLVLGLDFCGPNVIDHFFCDVSPFLELSCSDITDVQIEVSVVAIVLGLLQFVFIITTYICIFKAIFGISSITGRQKTFSTCSAHLTIVSIYYGTLCILYMAPTKGSYMNFTKVLSLLNSIITPLFNPIIYSLRNKEIQKAMVSFFKEKYF